MRRGRSTLMALAGATMVAIGGWAPSATAAPTTAASATVMVGSGSAQVDALVTVPRAANLKRADAARRVAEAGLQPFFRNLDGCTTVDRVISQSPGTGAQVEAGSQVVLWVIPIQRFCP